MCLEQGTIQYVLTTIGHDRDKMLVITVFSLFEFSYKV